MDLLNQSKEVVQLYKNELTNMVYQLDDDIKTLKNNIGTNKEDSEHAVSQEMSGIQSKKEGDQTTAKNEIEQKQQEQKNIIALLAVIQEYDKEIQNNQDNIEFLKEQIEFIENNLDSYFVKDPKQLVMIERDDFTNFHVFEEIPNIDQQAQKLITVNVFKNLTKDVKILKRVLYFLIYQFHEKIQYSLDQQLNNNNQRENDQKGDENQEQDNNQFIKETDNANIISQDSIEEQEDGSNTKLQRKKSSGSKSQEEDNWEIDDKMIAI